MFLRYAKALLTQQSKFIEYGMDNKITVESKQMFSDKENVVKEISQPSKLRQKLEEQKAMGVSIA